MWCNERKRIFNIKFILQQYYILTIYKNWIDMCVTWCNRISTTIQKEQKEIEQHKSNTKSIEIAIKSSYRNVVMECGACLCLHLKFLAYLIVTVHWNKHINAVCVQCFFCLFVFFFLICFHISIYFSNMNMDMIMCLFLQF